MKMNQSNPEDLESFLEYAENSVGEETKALFPARVIFADKPPMAVASIPGGMVWLLESWLCFITDDRDEPGTTHLAKEAGRAMLASVGIDIFTGLTGVTDTTVNILSDIFRKLRPDEEPNIREDLMLTNSFVLPTKKIIAAEPGVSINGGYILIRTNHKNIIVQQDMNIDSKTEGDGLVSAFKGVFKAYKGYKKGQWQPEFLAELKKLRT
jgi:hypothetical protein